MGKLTTIDYVTIDTTGNATSFGDLTTPSRTAAAGCDNNSRGCAQGGFSGSQSNVIDYVTIDTTGSATDFGDLTTARNGGSTGSGD